MPNTFKAIGVLTLGGLLSKWLYGMGHHVTSGFFTAIVASGFFVLAAFKMSNRTRDQKRNEKYFLSIFALELLASYFVMSGLIDSSGFKWTYGLVTGIPSVLFYAYMLIYPSARLI